MHSHTDRGALQPSDFLPHEKPSATESAKRMRSSNHKSNSSRSVPRTAAATAGVIAPARREGKKKLYASSRCQHPLAHTITGYAAAVIKVPFQHSTHGDLFQTKHSLSQLKPRPLRWDVKGHFYVCDKEGRIQATACNWKK